MNKLFEKIKYYTNPYRLYYRLCYYYPFGIRRINNLKEVKVNEAETTECRLEVDNQERKHHNFLYIKMKPDHWFTAKWFFWRRKFAFQLPGYGFWFKAPKLTPWSYNPETQETKFGLNHTLISRLSESGVETEKIRFVTWVKKFH